MTPARRWPRHALAVLATIRVRLTLWYVALLSLTLAAFSIFLYVNVERSVLAQLDHSIAVEAGEITSALLTDDRKSVYNDIASSDATSPELVALWDEQGRPLAMSTSPPPPPIRPDLLARALRGETSFVTEPSTDGIPLRVITLPAPDRDVRKGVLQIGRSEQGIWATLDALRTFVLLGIPISVFLAIAGGLFLAGRALGPIDRIRRTVDRIDADDLSGRLGFPARADELGQLAMTFDRLLARLDRSFQQQRRFTADVSHDLRTPLAVLVSRAELALERPRSASEYRQVLTGIRDDGRRMGRLLADLLTLARADAGQDVLARESVDLRTVAQDVVLALQPVAADRHVRLHAELSESAPLLGDEVRLTQLLTNLIVNAVAYTPPGGEVVVGVAHDGATVILRVCDTGVGIAPEHLPHVIERFYRVDAARSPNGGAGLGLAICQWVVHAHGGEITAQSQPGQGTEVTVRLPGAGAPAPAGVRQPSKVPPGG